MRFLPLLLLLFTLPLARAADRFSTYANARFGYSISYPANLLLPQPEAENGDGRKFLSRDGKIRLTVFGRNNVFDRSTREEWENARAAWRKDGARITLSRWRSDFFVISGFVGDEIFYEKTIRRGDTFATFFYEYPKSQRKRMDAAVTRAFGSFR